jgi:hypothetical protein
MAENRFHELLGLPEEVSDPDYYQLLGIDHSLNDLAAIEARFKEQMTRVQHIENPRHKEFLEFLKGELKRARAILTDEGRRREYDQELADERGDELRKILSHMLVDGTLSSVAEVSVLSEGRNLGLEPAYIRQVVDEELKKAGAKRVSFNGGGATEAQGAANRKAQEVARQAQEARMAARLAETRARIAETHKKKAEEQVAAVMIKARQAEIHKKKAEEQVQVVQKQARQQVLVVQQKARLAEESVRKALTRERAAAARQRMSEQERKELEEESKESQVRFQAFVEASKEELEAVRDSSVSWQRLAGSYAALFFALVAGGAWSGLYPGSAGRARAAMEPLLARAGSIPHPLVPLIGVGLLLIPLHLLTGRKVPLFIVPLLAMLALALAAGLLRV